MLKTFATHKARVRHLENIAVSVAKAYWSMGLGRHMMEVCMAWAKAHGVEVMEMLTDSTNLRALRLYLSLGFQIDGLLSKRWKNARSEYQYLYAMSKVL